MKNTGDLKRLSEDLHQSIREKDVHRVEELFIQHPSLFDEENFTQAMVETILLEASNCNDERVIEILMNSFKFGGTNNSLDLHLCLALSEGNVKLAELLMKYGGNIRNRKEPKMELYEKIFDRKKVNTRKSMIELLVKHDQLDTSFVDESDDNILHKFIGSVYKDDPDVFEVIDILIKAGVSLDEEDANSAVVLAVDRHFYELTHFLILTKGIDVNKKYYCNIDRYLLIMTSWLGQTDTVKILLRNKADVKVKNDDGWTALHVACWANESEIISLLIKSGAEISVKNNEGHTPFSMLFRDPFDQGSAVPAMVKEFARMSFENVAVAEEDINSILKNPLSRECYQECTKELNQMSSLKFYGSYTYYSVLKMSKNLRKLSKLVRNEELVRNFLTNFSFTIYTNDLMDVFNEAIRIRDDAKIIESRLMSVFGSFLPEVVVRKLVNHFSVDDLPVDR